MESNILEMPGYTVIIVDDASSSRKNLRKTYKKSGHDVELLFNNRIFRARKVGKVRDNCSANGVEQVKQP